MIFDAHRAGTPAADWTRDVRLTSAPDLDLTGLRHLVVVAAHPDDESLGAGGLLATAAARGVPTTVVVATRGEASHPGSTSHTRQDLAQRRGAELLRALSHLAPAAAVHLLGLPDGGVAAHETGLADVLARFVPTSPGHADGTWVAAPWRSDGHPDHEAAGRAAASACAATGARLLEYPVWWWHWGSPADATLPGDALVRLDLDESAAAAKRRAVDEHASQVVPLSGAPGDEPVVPPGFREHFGRPFEVFVTESTPTDATGDPEGTQDSASLDPAFFDDFYTSDDPWGFEDRWYERRKRAVLLASLPRDRFASAFEPGCSTGVLTVALAARCDALLATDVADRPLRLARERLAGQRQVRVERRRVPQEWPEGRFDLVVLSEVGYYCGRRDLEALVSLAAAALTDDGVLVAVHWRHAVPEYPLDGDDVHAALAREPGLRRLVRHEEEDFLLDVLVRPPASSVARADGLLGSVPPRSHP